MDPGDGRFTFALTPEWGRFLDPSYNQLTAQDLAAAGQQLLFLLRFDARECDPYLGFSELRDLDLLASSTWTSRGWSAIRSPVVEQRATKSNGVVVGPPRITLVGGERAVLLSFTSNVPGFRVHNAELWIPHRGAWFVVGFNVTHREDPGTWFDSLFPNVQAIMATWRWQA